MLTKLRDYKKDVKQKLEPFVTLAYRSYQDARQEMQKYLNAAEELDAKIAGPMADFKRQERLAAEAEERRINEERRLYVEKAAMEQRKLDEAAALQRRQQEMKRIAAAQKDGDIKKREAERMRKEAEERERLAKEQAARDAEAMKANVQDIKVAPAVPKFATLRGRVNYKFEVLDAGKVTRPFTKPDEVAIGQKERNDKDPEKSMREIGGIRVWTEDSI
jgi:hypothetical protein